MADVASEQRLAAGLARILPGVPVVGEEAVEKDPGLVDLIGRPGETCWIVDPLDGTENFAAGKDRFAMIICLVHDRLAVGGWILDVPRDRMAVALKGQGVDPGRQPRCTASRPARPPIGAVGYKVRKEFDRQLPPAARPALGRVSSLQLRRHRVSRDPVRQCDFNLYRHDQAVGPCRRRADARGGGRRGRCASTASPMRRPSRIDGRHHRGGIHPQTLAQVEGAVRGGRADCRCWRRRSEPQG